MTTATSAYRLRRTDVRPQAVLTLDERQRAVVAHAGGPLLVLAGPGTGKTTTLVEAVADRVARGMLPEEILVLTFSRKAAGELRDRIATRLRSGGGATDEGTKSAVPERPGGGAMPTATTFHSFCYALVRQYQPAELFTYPLRLLSGPEQDVFVRELLAGQAEYGTVRWPTELRAALGTRGFADEVRAVAARARELGLDPETLARFAAANDRRDWAAAAEFLAEYLDVLDAQGVVDYAELVHRAVILAERPEVADELRRRYKAVFVDEYQDTDAAQVRLLRALAGDGRDLVAVGDPDQSIYAFRGADVNGILDFRHRFPRRDGNPAETIVLRTSRRAGAGLLRASREIAKRMPLARLAAADAMAHRDLTAELTGEDDPSRVQVFTYPTPGAELDNIADILRRAHLEDDVPWGEMAVLVRSGARSIPAIRRALSVAGVPLEIAGDELPLAAEQAVTPLLTALRVAADPTALDEDTARMLLLSPIGGLDSADLRVLGRALRAEERAVSEAEAQLDEHRADGAAEETQRDAGARAAEGEGLGLAEAQPGTAGQGASGISGAGGPGAGSGPSGAGGTAGPALARAIARPSAELIRDALAHPEQLVAVEAQIGAGAYRLGRLIGKARAVLEDGGTAEAALWELWHGTPWPARLERAVLRGGAAGRNADRDLDAVVALFEVAARAEERAGHRGALNFLDELTAQQIPGDRLDDKAVRGESVRLLTAHRSKGLQWRLVVVAGVQEGLWPDLRRRGSLLEADRIGADGLAEPLSPGALLAEERRLFYVAATRARERLVVTAVKSAYDDGDQPSRFLDEVGGEEAGVERADITSRPRRALSTSALVAELRSAAVDPKASRAVQLAAARRLARLASLRDEDGYPLVPAAHPERWWGLVEPTDPGVPVRDPRVPVKLSGSAVEKVDTCALNWFLGREVRAESARSAALGFGNVVHALADEVGTGATAAELPVLMDRLDRVWDALAFDAPWQSDQQKEEARTALERFLAWHTHERHRVVAATEHEFEVSLTAGEHRIVIRGSMDRVERGADGLAYVVDFKTGKGKPTKQDVAEHPQLAVYQLAVEGGALDDVPAFGGARPRSGGAELVQLRHRAGAAAEVAALPLVQEQGTPVPDEEGRTWVSALLADVAGRILGERFTPHTGSHCDRCEFRRCCSARSEGRTVVE
ncbi:ATP-dependent helicase [Yinghuangia seranimata]|uniref:ATP-dependent helicase n=1 Tax=Yinghuangia seranimata TaxID=408067 RepID=UPI00248AE5CB|nr:ATP-dependent DNA helicase [Yinghuangia seranimata]MDI2131024.1 ATP-dependent DNA helicase [Yinghuangia seranimata]